MSSSSSSFSSNHIKHGKQNQSTISSGSSVPNTSTNSSNTNTKLLLNNFINNFDEINLNETSINSINSNSSSSTTSSNNPSNNGAYTQQANVLNKKRRKHSFISFKSNKNNTLTITPSLSAHHMINKNKTGNSSNYSIANGSDSSNFIRNLSNKLKSRRRRTNSLCELNKVSVLAKENTSSTTNNTNSNVRKNSKIDEIESSTFEEYRSQSRSNDQQVPSDSNQSKKKRAISVLNKSNVLDPKKDNFENFNSLTFYKQCNIVTDWFTNMNDDNKNSLLVMLLDHCGPSQNHIFSMKIVNPHGDCVPNCCDMISYLPKMISIQIFSYLDPASLARSSMVCRTWHEIANDSLLWKKLCLIPKWRFSQASEAKQIDKYKNENLPINWKEIFSVRFRVKRNWLSGKSYVKTFYGHEGSVSCVQFDETRIVAGSGEGTIKVWNISESSSSLSTTAQSSLMPYLNLVGHSGTIRCLQLDGKLNRLYSGSADHTIKAWDLSEVHPTWSRVTCKMTYLGHDGTVRCLQVNGEVLISGSYDCTLKIWNLKTGLCENTLRGHQDSVLCVQFDDQKIISGSADRTIRIWNFEGACLAQLEGHTGSVTCLHFDSQRIISGSLDFDIKFWRIDNGLCINTLNWITKEGHTGAIRCLKADNQKIVSCSDDKTIKIWNIETGERYVTLKNHSDGVTCLQFNDYYILSGSYDRTIKLHDFSYY